MSIRQVALAGIVTGLLLGTVAGLARWSQANIQLVIALGTLVGGAVFIALPDMVRRHRQ